ncbi:MAG: alpha/beta hydrolase [Anaerolineaceae bacterium]
MKILKKILVIVIAVFVVLIGAFIVWGETPAKPMPEAMTALQSDGNVNVTSGKWLVFSPVNEKATIGFIFYPGGRVDYRAYSPMAHALAAKGYLVVIPQMPLNLAVFGINIAGEVQAVYPQIQNWYIGGHSLGGSMAADYLYKHQTNFSGLVFLASYPASSDDLSNYLGKVLSLSGSLDGLATPAKIDASKLLLPGSSRFVEIQGGDHAFFGWYGPQAGDQAATITREAQQEIVVEQIDQLFK